MSDKRNVVDCGKCHNAKCTLSQMEIRMAVCTGYKPWTNYDRIHNMGVEKLADEFFDLFAAFYDVEWSKETLLKWLNTEVTCESAD